jgi:RNA polymerase sigma-70 factor (ECF subfamily)
MPGADHDDARFASDLAAARAGDGSAVDRILTATEDRLRRYVDARLGDRLRASLRHSDVLQNAYLEMLEALPDFAGRTADDFVAWVGRIVEHDIQRQHRHFSAKKRMQPRTSERNALARILLEPPPTPSGEVVGSERRALVRAALARLEPTQARIIELAMLEELPHKQVAERMGRSEGACRMLLMRARAALAIELDRLDRDSR